MRTSTDFIKRIKFKSCILVYLLCTTDLHAQQLTLVKDIWPGTSGAVGMFHKSLVFNDRLYFTANDGTHGEEYWSSDGTESGTEMLKDIHVGSPHATPDYTQYQRFPGMCEFDGFLYFTANSAGFGEELWRTDGSAANTEICQDIHPGNPGASPTFFHQYKDMMFFTAIHPEFQREPFILRHDEISAEPIVSPLGDLYSINGTLSTMWNTYSLQNSGTVITFLDTLIFRWYGLSSGLETWITNGTPQATGLLFDNYQLGNMEMSSSPNDYAILQDTILCYSAENEDGMHLWTITRDHSTSNGLVNTLIASPNPTGTSNIQELYVHDDRLYFSADDGVHGQELWVSDGTASGTFMLKDISSGANSSFPKNFVSFNGKVYFTTFDGLDEGHIWITDGTAEGTVNTAGIWDIGLTQSTADMNWMEYNGKLYYAGFNKQMSEHYLCVTDGTAGGTNWVIPSNGGSKIQLFNSFNKFIVMNNELYFIANPASGETGPELYKLTDAVSIDASITEDNARLIAYPNPAMDALTIQRTGSLTHADLSIFNVNGQLMVNEKITLHSTRLTISDWPSGIYFIRYADQSQINYLKFVKN